MGIRGEYSSLIGEFIVVEDREDEEAEYGACGEWLLLLAVLLLPTVMVVFDVTLYDM